MLRQHRSFSIPYCAAARFGACSRLAPISQIAERPQSIPDDLSRRPVRAIDARSPSSRASIRHINSLRQVTMKSASSSRTPCNNVCRRMGFVRCSAQPAARMRLAAVTSEIAVNAATGVRGNLFSVSQRRISVVAAYPSSTGISMSMKTRLKGSAARLKASIPSRPFLATVRAIPGSAR